MAGVLYIVATPIGNLKDMTPRAIEVLSAVDVIAAEDTRHSKPLLTHFKLSTRLIAYHDHNESTRSEELLNLLQQGKSVALISDAGTPLISDPGYQLVHKARQRGIIVEPIPGACALIAALSAAGLPTDNFYFAGFLPSKTAARNKRLDELAKLSTTIICYESPQRVVATLTAMQTIFAVETQCVIARELTKKYETFYHGSIATVLAQFTQQAAEQRGEFVIMLHNVLQVGTQSGETQRILKILLQELPLKQAVKLAAEITQQKKNTLYEWALAQQS